MFINKIYHEHLHLFLQLLGKLPYNVPAKIASPAPAYFLTTIGETFQLSSTKKFVTYTYLFPYNYW